MGFRFAARHILRGRPATALLRLLAALTALAACASAAAQDFTLRQQLGAVASGEGAANGLFGWDVAIDGDLAVACDARLDGSPARVRTWQRSGQAWQRLPVHDVVLYGDSGCRLALAEGTLAITQYGSTAPSRGYINVFAWTDAGWDQEYGVSTTADFYDAIATSGSIVAVGAPLHDSAGGDSSGRVRVLRRSGNGNWTSSYINPPTAQEDAYFGQSVAIVAGAIAVGAPGMDVDDGGTLREDAGAAYVFELTIDTWSLAASLTEPDGGIGAGHRFGSAVAISGLDPSTPDRLLVSSPSSEDIAHAGIVRAYVRAAGSWSEAFSFGQSGSPADDQFGCSLAMDGAWAVIGACASNAIADDAGAIRVVRFNDDFEGVASSSQRTDPGSVANDHFGGRVGIDREGPVVIAGNPAANLHGNTSQGVVLTSIGTTGDVPALTRSLELGQGLTGARASQFAVGGDAIVIGASGEDVGSQHQRGAAYVYRRGAGGYVFEARVLAPDGMAGDQFGATVALQGDRLLVGAPGRASQGEPQAGAVYAFRRMAGTWTLEAQWVPGDPGYETTFGFTLALDGSTAMVGEFGENTSVFERSAEGTWSLVQALPYRAWSLALRGDHAFLGDPNAADGVGSVAFYRRENGWWEPRGTLAGTTADQGFGRGVDVDGDLIAVASSDAAVPVLLYQRSGETWLPSASLLPEDVTADTICARVALRGSTLLLGCNEPGYEGAVYVLERVAGSWTQVQKLTLPDARALDVFGNPLAIAPGGWLFAGAFGRDLDFIDEGAVYVYAGDRLFSDGFE